MVRSCVLDSIENVEAGSEIGAVRNLAEAEAETVKTMGSGRWIQKTE